MSTSPRSESLMSTPGSGEPTVSSLTRPSRCRVAGAQHGGHRLALELETRPEHPAGKKELREVPLEPVGILDAHLGLGEDILPDTRRREGHGRADLPEIVT